MNVPTPLTHEQIVGALFPQLSEAEKRLLAGVPKGITIFGGSPEDEDNPPVPYPAENDPAQAGSWAAHHRVRADLIRWLCVDRNESAAIDPRGIKLCAAKVIGKLDLSYVTVAFPLSFERCVFEEDADLSYVKAPSLSFTGCRMKAVTVDGANVAGDLSFDEGFVSEGGVRLLTAQIGGNLECNAGAFENAGSHALWADRVKIAGTAFLGQFAGPGPYNGRGFRAQGTVRLVGAQLGGVLECSGGSFHAPQPAGQSPVFALLCDRMKAGNIFFREQFSAEGEVRLLGAEIGGDLNCVRGRFTKLTLERVTIKGSFYWTEVGNRDELELDLDNATFGPLEDEVASWPDSGRLSLDGFSYSRISERAPSNVEERLRWLSLASRFTLQPYQQLAKVLKDGGDVDAPPRVLYEMELLRHRSQDRGWLQQAGSSILRWTIGYGQIPLRALWWLLGLILVGAVFFGLGYLGGVMTPNDKDSYSWFTKNGYAPNNVSEFNALIYSMENSFSVINLGVKSQWQPAPRDAAATAPVVHNEWLNCLKDNGIKLTSVVFLRTWMWTQTIASWLLATLFVAGLSGVVKSS